MGFTDDTDKEIGGGNRLRLSESLHLEFEILWKEFTRNDLPTIEMRCQPPVAKEGR